MIQIYSMGVDNSKLKAKKSMILKTSRIYIKEVNLFWMMYITSVLH